jgi:hypothetical protein
MPDEHPGNREADVVHRRESVVVERIEADRDARNPGVLRRPRLGGERGVVGGERDVGDPVDPRANALTRIERVSSSRVVSWCAST